ncbi:EAL domain-containing protein [Erythrobacter sp. SCSIO 43205]|uniref:EAL domain-containing protein n=1 Tax=Erythrobacter sp. SCSIO 43205 TaxID=2779361 RepID=UPI001CA969BD|nr:EAL domain-containing protein [Erythrobacter sp. SCSIO 43205]UAB77169.1 EAL domain-containing protein [Erythrobacter sp. SCSIO 43205]
MSYSLFVLVCVLIAAAALAGWFAARLTYDAHEVPSREDKRQKTSPTLESSGKEDRTKALKRSQPGTASAASGKTESSHIASSARSALRNGLTHLAYQPKLNLRQQCFGSAEALLRFDDSKLRSKSISDIIAAAEQSDIIEELTLWTMKQAVEDQLELIDQGIGVTTFINLSASLISDSEFTLKAIDVIKGACGKVGIEITETAIIENTQHALANLELYRAAGAQIAIDDYGTGLSSLSYLKQMPAQELKIDREFIKDLTSSHRDPMIVRSTIELAHALGLKVTAEGIEDATQLALLKVMGCDLLQGFFIARPMPLSALIEFLSDEEKLKSVMNPEVSLLPRRVMKP